MQSKDNINPNCISDDLSKNPTIVIIIACVIGALAIGAIMRWLWLKRKNQIKFCDYLRIVKLPKTMFHYIISTFYRHSLEYFAFVAVPLILGISLRKSLLSLWAIWGFMVTTMSAFYAARADYSSNAALMSSNDAFAEARKTYLSVLNFADDMKSFIERVKHDLSLMEGDITVRFLTVIPAFGSVGLREYYNDMKMLGAYKEFHLYLAEKIKSSEGSKLKILTHGGRQTVDWIFNILQAGNRGSEQQSQIPQVVKDTKKLYLEQKKYVRDMIGGYGEDNLDWRIWNTQKIPKLECTSPISIPFQFLLVKHGTYEKVYFLFSGSYLYEFILKSVDIEVDMSSLVTLTKGYYIDQDKQLLGIFDKIFESLFKNMEQLNHTKDIDNIYGNEISITYDSQNYDIDITEEYTQYNKSKP